MRTELKQRNQRRFAVIATVKRYGGKLTHIPAMRVHSWQETILLVDVRDATTDDFLTDHIWFKVGKSFEKLRAKSGDRICFDARVDKYFKKDGKEDYHLERPTKLKIIDSNPDLFPEEIAKVTGTGIRYAMTLREKYQQKRNPDFNSQMMPDDSDDFSWA